jgi:hypothetical protein
MDLNFDISERVEYFFTVYLKNEGN